VLAVPGARRPGDGERPGAAGELPVGDQEGQPAEMVAVQVRDEHRGDLAGLTPSGRRWMHAWSRPPLPNASPLPAKVTVTPRGSVG